MTQIESARSGIVTPEIRHVAQIEKQSIPFIMERVADGRIVIPANVKTIKANAFGSCRSLKNVTFTNSNGWQANSIELESSILQNERTAAAYLTDNYLFSVWTRK